MKSLNHKNILTMIPFEWGNTTYCTPTSSSQYAPYTHPTTTTTPPQPPSQITLSLHQGLHRATALEALSQGVFSVSKTLDACKLVYVDAHDRKHFLDVTFVGDTFKYSYKLPEVWILIFSNSNSYLQETITLDTSSLNTLYLSFKELVNSFQPFFNAMHSIDQSAWVLDPVVTHASKSRRIYLEAKLVLLLDVSAQDPLGLPILMFLGPDSLALKFKTRVHQLARSLWDPSRGLVENVLDVLGLDKFPKSDQGEEEKEEEEDLLECGICYCSDLDGSLPEVACPECGHLYHKSCLVTWLSSFTVKRLGYLRGECIFCEKPMSVAL